MNANATAMDAPIERPVSFLKAVLDYEINLENGRQIMMFLCTGAVIVVYYVLKVILAFLFNLKIHVVGYQSFFESARLVSLRFTRGGPLILREKYNKFKEGMSKVWPNDADIFTIPRKYVDKLQDIKEK